MSSQAPGNIGRARRHSNDATAARRVAEQAHLLGSDDALPQSTSQPCLRDRFKRPSYDCQSDAYMRWRELSFVHTARAADGRVGPDAGVASLRHESVIGNHGNARCVQED